MLQKLACAGRRAILLLTLSLTQATSILAQRTPPPGFGIGKTPVVIAVVDKLPEPIRDAEVVIVRRAKMTPHDVILVSRNRVRADWLAEAVWTLKAARSVEGIIPKADAMYRIALRPGSPDRKELNEIAKECVNALKNDPGVRPVEGYGELAHFVLYIPDSLPKMKVVRKPQ